MFKSALRFVGQAFAILVITLVLDFILTATLFSGLKSTWVNADTGNARAYIQTPWHHDLRPHTESTRLWGSILYPWRTDRFGLRTGPCAPGEPDKKPRGDLRHRRFLHRGARLDLRAEFYRPHGVRCRETGQGGLQPRCRVLQPGHLPPQDQGRGGTAAAQAGRDLRLSRPLGHRRRRQRLPGGCRRRRADPSTERLVEVHQQGREVLHGQLRDRPVRPCSHGRHPLAPAVARPAPARAGRSMPG